MLNLSFHTRVMLYQKILAGTTFDTIPQFDNSMALLFSYIDKFAFLNDKYYYGIVSRKGNVGRTLTPSIKVL